MFNLFHFLYLMFLILSSTKFGECSDGKVQPFRTWHVKVVNRMSGGEALTLHCRSADDDLHFRTLWPGQEFSWKFKINVWTTTLYFCHAWHGVRGRYYHAVFDVFRASDGAFEALLCEPNSNWCVWEARDDGVWTTTENLHHKWEKVQGGASAPEEAPVG